VEMKSKPETKIRPQAAAIEPKFKMKGSRTIFHHLFRAQLADFLKNKSFKKDQPDITKVPHVHFYHTCNSTGKPQQFTAAVGGHFHEVTWSLDPISGEPVAKCGPPLKKVALPGPDGLTVYENQPIEFLDKVGSMGKRGRLIVDEHTHDMLYEGTDEITSDKIRETQGATRAALTDGLESARQTLAANNVSIGE